MKVKCTEDGSRADREVRPLFFRARLVGDFADKSSRHGAPVVIWAYELAWSGSGGPLDADTIIDRCFDGIQRCDLFVFILKGRHGSGTSLVGDDQTTSSYLQLELFAAAAFNKPIVVLHYRDRDPEPALLDGMLLLRRAFRSEHYFIDSEQGLFDRWNEIIAALAAGRTIKSTQPGLLAEGLSRARTSYSPLPSPGSASSSTPSK